MRRVLSLLLAAVLLAGVMGGCTQGPEPERPPAEEQPEESALRTPVAREGAIDPVTGGGGYPVLQLDPTLQQGTEPEQFSSFQLGTEENPQLPFNLVCNVTEPGKVIGLFPDGTDLTGVVPTFRYDSGTVSCQGTPVVSGVTALDLSSPRELELTEENGAVHKVTVEVQTLYTGLPAVSLTTEDMQPILSKTETVPCTLTVSGGDPNCCPYAVKEPLTVTAQIRGRGNTSWSAEKKGYSFNLDEPAGLLDLPSARKWALVSNYEDKSLLRNVIGEYLSGQVGMESRLEVRPVDLWYNGLYWGTYNLCERISIHPARVDITEQDSVEGLKPEEVAYLFEFDGHVEENNGKRRALWEKIGYYVNYDPYADEVFFQFNIGKKWLTIKQPEYSQLTAEMADYAYEEVYYACLSLKKANWEAINSYLDVRSFVKWYIVEEFMNNTDSSMHSSVFMYKDAGGKFTLGPTWDFDRSSGNCDYWNPGDEVDSLYTSGAGWFKYLFQCQEAREMLKEEWNAFYEKIADIGEVVDRQAAMLSVSQQYNFERWNILYRHVGANPRQVVEAHSYPEQVKILREFVIQKREKMNRFINGL